MGQRSRYPFGSLVSADFFFFLRREEETSTSPRMKISCWPGSCREFYKYFLSNLLIRKKKKNKFFTQFCPSLSIRPKSNGPSGRARKERKRKKKIGSLSSSSSFIIIRIRWTTKSPLCLFNVRHSACPGVKRNDPSLLFFLSSE